MTKVVCISMARMTSTRLPGKVLMEVEGQALLDVHVKRLQQAKNVDEVYVATTTNEPDNAIVDFCQARNINYSRGSEMDVLSRYLQCAELAQADVIVRVTSDCPLIDPDIIDGAVEQFLVQDECDYVHADIGKFPRGFDCEVFSRQTLIEADAEATSPIDREHVTSFIYGHPERYKVTPHTTSEDNSELRLCVDEQADLELIRKIAAHFGEALTTTPWQDIVAQVRAENWDEINRQVQQKTY